MASVASVHESIGKEPRVDPDVVRLSTRLGLPTTPSLRTTTMLVNGLFGFFFFTTSLKPAEFTNEGCLSDNYYGTYGDTSLFLLSPDSECFASLRATAPPGLVESGVLSVTEANHQLMYIRKMPVQGDADSATQLTEALERLNAHTADPDSGISDLQTTFSLGLEGFMTIVFPVARTRGGLSARYQDWEGKYVGRHDRCGGKIRKGSYGGRSME